MHSITVFTVKDYALFGHIGFNKLLRWKPKCRCRAKRTASIWVTLKFF